MVSQTPTRFDEAKALATSASCQAYYDIAATVILQVHASDYGLGAAILQPSKHLDRSNLDESCLQPVAYRSKSLTFTEKRYTHRKRMPCKSQSFQQI